MSNKYFLILAFIDIALSFVFQYNLKSTSIPKFMKNKIDGLEVRRVDISQLSELFNRPVYYYEVNNWKVAESEDGKEGTTDSNPVYVLGSFTYGANLWPACLAVSYKLYEDKSFINGKSILDVGCGVGLASIVSAYCDAKSVIAADISPLTLKLMNEAMQELNLSNIIDTLEFDLLNENIELPNTDIVLFADVLYSKQLGIGVAKRVYEAKCKGKWVIVVSFLKIYYNIFQI